VWFEQSDLTKRRSCLFERWRGLSRRGRRRGVHSVHEIFLELRGGILTKHIGIGEGEGMGVNQTLRGSIGVKKKGRKQEKV